MKLTPALVLFSLLLLVYGCHDNGSEAPVGEVQPRPESSAGSIYLACSKYKIRHMEGSSLGFFDESGRLFFVNDKSDVSFMTGPAEYTLSENGCDLPLGVGHDGMYGIIMPDGRLFADRLFENSYGLYKNTLAYSEGGQWGLITGDGVIIVPPSYDEIAWHRNGRFIAKRGDRRFLMDHLGALIPIEEHEDYSATYQDLMPPRKAYLSCPDGTRRSSKDGRWGIVDEEGAIVLTPKFRAVSCLHNGKAWAPDEDNRRWCQYDSAGQITTVCRPEFYFYRPTHHDPKKLAEDPFENSVIWNRRFLDYGEGRVDDPPELIGDGVQGFGALPAAPIVREEMEPDWFK